MEHIHRAAGLLSTVVFTHRSCTGRRRDAVVRKTFFS